MPAYTDNKNRPWDLTPEPLHDKPVGGTVVGYLCWVKSTAPGVTHPGDYARTTYGVNGVPIVSKTPADAETVSQWYADNHP